MYLAESRLVKAQKCQRIRFVAGPSTLFYSVLYTRVLQSRIQMHTDLQTRACTTERARLHPEALQVQTHERVGCPQLQR